MLFCLTITCQNAQRNFIFWDIGISFLPSMNSSVSGSNACHFYRLFERKGSSHGISARPALQLLCANHILYVSFWYATCLFFGPFLVGLVGFWAKVTHHTTLRIQSTQTSFTLYLQSLCLSANPIYSFFWKFANLSSAQSKDIWKPFQPLFQLPCTFAVWSPWRCPSQYG